MNGKSFYECPFFSLSLSGGIEMDYAHSVAGNRETKERLNKTLHYFRISDDVFFSLLFSFARNILIFYANSSL